MPADLVPADSPGLVAPLAVAGLSQVASPILWQLSFPVLVVDALHRVLYANRAATDVLADASALVLRGERLDCVHRADRVRLESALQACFAEGGGPTVRPPRAPRSFCLSSGADHATLTLSVARLDPPPAGGPPLLPDSGPLPPPAATVILNRSRALHASHRAVLRELFDLTHSEAIVAEALWDGLTVAEIAAARMTSTTTVRSQIRTLFAKTMVTRQQDLIRLLASLPQLAIGPLAPG